MKKRTDDPWIPAMRYGALVPQFMANLVVRDIELALEFYAKVLLAKVHYADPDFAALRLHCTELMLHAEHAYKANPWAGALNG